MTVTTTRLKFDILGNVGNISTANPHLNSINLKAFI